MLSECNELLDTHTSNLMCTFSSRKPVYPSSVTVIHPQPIAV